MHTSRALLGVRSSRRRSQVLPFYVNLALMPFGSEGELEKYEKLQKILTMLRLLRVFRVMKLARHSQDLQARVLRAQSGVRAPRWPQEFCVAC